MTSSIIQLQSNFQFWYWFIHTTSRATLKNRVPEMGEIILDCTISNSIHQFLDSTFFIFWSIGNNSRSMIIALICQKLENFHFFKQCQLLPLELTFLFYCKSTLKWKTRTDNKAKLWLKVDIFKHFSPKKAQPRSG